MNHIGAWRTLLWKVQLPSNHLTPFAWKQKDSMQFLVDRRGRMCWREGAGKECGLGGTLAALQICKRLGVVTVPAGREWTR